MRLVLCRSLMLRGHLWFLYKLHSSGIICHFQLRNLYGECAQHLRSHLLCRLGLDSQSFVVKLL